MITLSDITFLSVDCVDLNRINLAADICNYYCKPFQTKILTSISKNHDNKYSYVEIPKIKNVQEYSDFIIKELYHYFETPFILLFQWDGFILNPNNWKHEYLNYDYIGAPWFSYDEKYDVGNGGFSLRSKKLHELLLNDDIHIGAPEDVIISRNYSDYLRNEGILYPSVDLASCFSVENRKWEYQFGFHDFRNTDLILWNDKHLLKNK